MGTLRVPRYPSPAFRPRFPAQTDEPVLFYFEMLALEEQRDLPRHAVE